VSLMLFVHANCKFGTFTTSYIYIFLTYSIRFIRTFLFIISKLKRYKKYRPVTEFICFISNLDKKPARLYECLLFVLLFHLFKLKSRHIKNKLSAMLYSIFMYGHFPTNILLQYIKFKDLYL